MPLRRLSSNMSHNLVKYAEEKESKVVGLTPSGTAFTRSTGTARTEDRSARLSRCVHGISLLVVIVQPVFGNDPTIKSKTSMFGLLLLLLLLLL
jgi:hypothetical protein